MILRQDITRPDVRDMVLKKGYGVFRNGRFGSNDYPGNGLPIIFERSKFFEK